LWDVLSVHVLSSLCAVLTLDNDPKLVGFWNSEKSEKGQLTVE